MATDSLASTAPTHDTPPATKCVKGFEPSQQPATAAAVPQLPVRNNPPMIVPATTCRRGTVLHDLDLRVQDFSKANFSRALNSAVIGWRLTATRALQVVCITVFNILYSLQSTRVASFHSLLRPGRPGPGLQSCR